MDRNKDYYKILDIPRDSDSNKIKKTYYKLSFKHHPDQNKDVDVDLFNKITEAYKVLSDESKRDEYDKKSKWGQYYNEYYELFDIDIELDHDYNKQKVEDFRKNQVYNIQIEVDPDTFDGNLEYERWVKCKSCDGAGKDLSSKIVIRDNDGNVVKVFDGEDGCDFCDGTGKDYRDEDCNFCFGKGKVGLNNCKSCDGEKRILGNQKLNNIKLTSDKTRIESMGHFSRDGKVGYLLITY